MKLLKIVDMMDIKEYFQVWSLRFLIKKNRIGNKCKWITSWRIHKPVTKIFKRRRLYTRLNHNNWAGDLDQMRLLSSKNKNVKYFLCSIDVFTKYTWIISWKDKKSKTVLNVFIERVIESNRKPDKLWSD